MIKKIIFDLDNTIIIWKKEYIRALENTIKYFNLKIDSNAIDNIINNLENKYSTISKEALLNDINITCNLNMKISFINKLFEEQKKLSEIDHDVIDTLKYLSKKYELVILSNYFTEVQEGRLKKANIAQYFTKIYGGDKILLKPRKEAFEKAIGNYRCDECIMVGDDPIIDIEGAKALKIRTIVCDYFNNLKCGEYETITEFKQLKKLL